MAPGVTGVDCTECTAQATVQRPRNITRRSLLTDTDTQWKHKRIQAVRLTHKRARMHTHMQAQKHTLMGTWSESLL